MGHYADETMIPVEPQRYEFADEGSFMEAYDYYQACQAERHHIDQVFIDGIYVSKRDFAW